MIRMLVADDSSAIQKVIRIAFAGFQARIEEAFSLQQGLVNLEKQAFDLIILDVNLPGLKGGQALPDLKAKAGSAQFILLAGSYDEFKEDEFRSRGFRHFLKKPFEATGLITQVKVLLGPKLTDPAADAKGLSQSDDGPRDRTKELIDIGRKGRKAFDPNLALDLEGHSSPELSAAKPSSGRPIKLSELDLGKKDFVIEPDPPYDQGPSFTDFKSAPVSGLPASGTRANSQADTKTSAGGIAAMNSAAEAANPAKQKRGTDSAVRTAVSMVPKEDAIDWAGLEERMATVCRDLTRKELSVLVKNEVRNFCQENFAVLAKQVLTEEIRRLAGERQRILDES